MAEWSPPAPGGAAGVQAGGALDAVELEDESSDGGGGVATALPGSRRLALSESRVAEKQSLELLLVG